MAKLKPDFFEHIFKQIPGPLYVINLKNQTFHLVNESFAELMQGSCDDFKGQPAIHFVAKEDWPELLRTLEKKRSRHSSLTYSFRARTLKGTKIPLEVSGIQLEAPWQEFEVGVVKDLSGEKQLEIEVARERENTLKAFQSTARIWHITDMIRAAFNAMEDLVKAQTVDELLQEAVDLLTSSKGLDFRCATIYLNENRRLNVAKSVGDEGLRSISLDKNGRLSRIFKGTEVEEDLHSEDKVIVLRGPKKTLGLLRVIEHDNIDQELLTESIQRLRNSIVKTFANTLSLMIRNIQLYRKIEEQSIRDPLTKVYNRRYFDQKVGEEIAKSSRLQQPLAVMLLDIDHFKKVNDVYGHLQGDKILEELGKLLWSRVRETDVVCRYGGEEFVILLSQTSLETALSVAEQIRAMVESHGFSNLQKDSHDPYRITVSIGISSFKPYGKNRIVESKSLISDADTALYQAKESGRNCVVKGHEIMPT